MILPMPATGGPSRGAPSTSGSDFGSSAESWRRRSGQQHLADDVDDVVGQIADMAVVVEQSRLLLAFRPIAQQFHRFAPERYARRQSCVP